MATEDRWGGGGRDRGRGPFPCSPPSCFVLRFFLTHPSASESFRAVDLLDPEYLAAQTIRLAKAGLSKEKKARVSR